MAERFHLLKFGLALVLMLVGIKMLIAEWFKISVAVSLGIVVAVLGTSMLLSIMTTQKEKNIS